VSNVNTVTSPKCQHSQYSKVDLILKLRGGVLQGAACVCNEFRVEVWSLLPVSVSRYFFLIQLCKLLCSLKFTPPKDYDGCQHQCSAKVFANQLGGDHQHAWMVVANVLDGGC